MVLDISTEDLLRVERERRFNQIAAAEAQVKDSKPLAAEIETALEEHKALGKRIQELRVLRQKAVTCITRAESAKAWLEHNVPEWIRERMQELVAEKTDIIETMQPLEQCIRYVDARILTAPMEERAGMQKRRADAKDELQPLIERRKEISKEIQQLTKRCKTEAWPEP